MTPINSVVRGWLSSWISRSSSFFLFLSFSQQIKGFNPPPTVTPVPSEGYLCPPGQEYNSLEWELARWVVDNKVSVRLRHHLLSVSVPVSVSVGILAVRVITILSQSMVDMLFPHTFPFPSLAASQQYER